MLNQKIMKTIFNLNKFIPVNLYKGNSINKEIYNVISKPCYVDFHKDGVIYKKSLFINYEEDNYKILYNNEDIADFNGPHFGYDNQYSISSFKVMETGKPTEKGILSSSIIISKIYNEEIDNDLYKILIRINQSSGIIRYEYFYGDPKDDEYTTLFMQKQHPDCCGVNLLYNFEIENTIKSYNLTDKFISLILFRRAPKLIHLASYQKKAIRLIENNGGIKLSSYSNPNSSHTINVYHFDNLFKCENFKKYE